MLNNLKEALYNNLELNTTLTDFINHKEVDPNTGNESIAIFQSSPSHPSLTRQVAFDVLSSTPLNEDTPNSYRESEIYLYGLANQSDHADYIADVLDCWFTEYDGIGSRSCWFRDFSNDCVSIKYGKYVDRVRAGKVTIKGDTARDMWASGIIIRVFWSRGCGVCPDFQPVHCNPSIPDIELDPNCCE